MLARARDPREGAAAAPFLSLLGFLVTATEVSHEDVFAILDIYMLQL